jgi:hypothetical protein
MLTLDVVNSDVVNSDVQVARRARRLSLAPDRRTEVRR